MELEDADFIEMVDEMKIDYDEQDLKQIEREVTSQLNRRGAGTLGIWLALAIFNQIIKTEI